MKEATHFIFLLFKVELDKLLLGLDLLVCGLHVGEPGVRLADFLEQTLRLRCAIHVVQLGEDNCQIQLALVFEILTSGYQSYQI
jgi:hypothetical protein